MARLGTLSAQDDLTGVPQIALHVTADGNWLEIRRPASAGARRPALFLDRDGVIIAQIDYLADPKKVELLPGAAATIAAANRAGWPVVVATNQSGVGRGYFTWEIFAAVQDAMHDRLRRAGAAVDMVLACAFHPEGKDAYKHPAHPWRKPRPGMILEAARALDVDLARSWFVGDHEIDMLAARGAGLRGGLHVMTGHGPVHRDAALAAATADFPVVAIAGIGDVPDRIDALRLG